VNILCFHIFMNHEGWQLASVVAALALFLLGVTGQISRDC
jgi:hypothetical protein